MRYVLPIIKKVSEEFKKLSGRDYGLIENYKMDNAERAIIVMGSTVGTAKDVVDDLRSEGEKVGLIKIRVFRPFPYDEISKSLSNIKAAAVLDKAISFGTYGGPVYTDVLATLYNNNGYLPLTNYIYGLGGRDIDKSQIVTAFEGLKEIVKTGKITKGHNYLGLRD